MANDHSFRKSLNLFDSTAIVVGSMIGSGIFIVSADIARQVGSPGLLMAVWLITGFLTVCAALSYGELAGMFPKAGGQYVYLKESYNPLVGFLYGWTLFLVIQTGRSQPWGWHLPNSWVLFSHGSRNQSSGFNSDS